MRLHLLLDGNSIRERIGRMRSDPDSVLGRREFLKACLAVSAPLVMAARGQSMFPGEVAAATGKPLAPTPACQDDDDLTPAAIEGPFYKLRSPKRASLWEPGTSGIRIVLVGQVVSRGCRPLSRALLDFWHADATGDYDNAGFRFRGHQYTDGNGRYRLETVVPGEYGFRTRHFHVKVQAPSGRVLTTQLYFPGEPRNKRDFLFTPELLMSVSDTRDGKHATFDFILDVS
jgi:protocatechuate 3,4-dioxygenase beta subunit